GRRPAGQAGGLRAAADRGDGGRYARAGDRPAGVPGDRRRHGEVLSAGRLGRPRRTPQGRVPGPDRRTRPRQGRTGPCCRIQLAGVRGSDSRGLPPSGARAAAVTTTVLSCPAPYGGGGLGRHLAELVAAARAGGGLVRYFATDVPPDDPLGEAVAVRWVPWA